MDSRADAISTAAQMSSAGIVDISCLWFDVVVGDEQN